MQSEKVEPEVKLVSLGIKAAGRDDMVLPVPENGKPEGLWFTLKEGSQYRLVFTFQVSHNIVSGLKYTNTVWKTGLKGMRVSLSLQQIKYDDVDNHIHGYVRCACNS